MFQIQNPELANHAEYGNACAMEYVSSETTQRSREEKTSWPLINLSAI